MLNREQIQAVFFDLDGTLMDTDDQAVADLTQHLKRLHWPSAQRAARRFLMRSETPMNAFLTLLDILGLDTPFNRLVGWLRRSRRAPDKPVFAIVEGVHEMLKTLQGRYRLGVITTRGEADARAFLRQHGLVDVFEILVTRESVHRLKPHPAPVLHASRALGLAPEQCVMVGDTTMDILAARRAGAWAVAVLCGFGERAELERAGAHVVLSCTPELTSVL